MKIFDNKGQNNYDIVETISPFGLTILNVENILALVGSVHAAWNISTCMK
jgi:hypothetical protein